MLTDVQTVNLYSYLEIEVVEAAGGRAVEVVAALKFVLKDVNKYFPKGTCGGGGGEG